MALVLPFMVLLLFFTINAYLFLHTSHVSQRYAAMQLWQRVDNRAQFVKDGTDNARLPAEFIAVEHQDDGGGVPKRKIASSDRSIRSAMGVCREPIGACGR